MEGVNNGSGGNLSIGATYQYRKWTFLNVSQDIKVVEEPADTFSWSEPKTPREEIDARYARFSDYALYRNPDMAVVKKEVDQATDAAIQGFFDGTVSEEELGEKFQDLLAQLDSACEENGYPCYIYSHYDQIALMESFYGELRRKILAEATARNYAEGSQYVSGEPDHRRAWKSYNSDYYFQSERAISAITDAVQDTAANTRGGEDFAIKDYKAEGLNLYYNFNSAFSNNFAVEEQYMLDPDQVPPKDFQWFFQVGVTPEDAPGKVYVGGAPAPTHFDPNDSDTGTMWARYRDDEGTWHQISRDVFFETTPSPKNLYNVGALMQFSLKDAKQSAILNRFLKNFQVYPAYHFERVGNCPSFTIRKSFSVRV